MKCLCLQAMAIVYGRHHEDIGPFNDTKYILAMLDRYFSKINFLSKNNFFRPNNFFSNVFHFLTLSLIWFQIFNFQYFHSDIYLIYLEQWIGMNGTD